MGNCKNLPVRKAKQSQKKKEKKQNIVSAGLEHTTILARGGGAGAGVETHTAENNCKPME